MFEQAYFVFKTAYIQKLTKRAFFGGVWGGGVEKAFFPIQNKQNQTCTQHHIHVTLSLQFFMLNPFSLF